MAFNKNEALRKVEDELNKRRMDSRRMKEERISEINTKFPEYGELGHEYASLSVEMVRARLEPDKLKALEDKRDSLKERQNEILEKNGYGSDYLEEKHCCPFCNDSGRLKDTGERCSCFRQLYYNALYSQNMMDEQKCFDDVDLNLQIGEDGEKFTEAYDSAVSFSNSVGNSFENLLFIGGVGLGKTLLSSCIATEVLKQGYCVLYQSSSQILTLLIDARFNKENREDLDIFYTCDLLILDDLGTEYLSEPADAELFELLDQRIKNKKNTVISSNKDLSMLRETYGSRIVSRILENYKICMFTGQDVRAIHARGRVLNNK